MAICALFSFAGWQVKLIPMTTDTPEGQQPTSARESRQEYDGRQAWFEALYDYTSEYERAYEE